MENVKKLLDEIKDRSGIKTDYALAKLLEIPRPRIHDYYKGKRSPDEFACLQIAQALGKPLAEVIAAVKIDTEKDEKRRSAWEKYYKQLGGVAASVVFAVLLNVTLIVTPAEASPAPLLEPIGKEICIMLSIAWLIREVLAALGGTKIYLSRQYCSG